MPTRVAQALATHERLSSYIGDEALVFCHPRHGGYLSDQTIRDRYRKGAQRQAFARSAFTTGAITHGTLMASAGTPLRVLQGLMGRASYATTEVYAKWAPDQTAEFALAERAFLTSSEPELSCEASLARIT